MDSQVICEKAAKNKEIAFYAGQMNSARFFILTLLPATYGKMDAITEADTCVEEMQDASFGAR